MLFNPVTDAPVNAAILGLAARFLRRDARSSSEATASSSESKNETDALVDTWTRFVAAFALECARAVEPIARKCVASRRRWEWEMK